MKLLLDTDPGSDIDDAIALCYLLAHPECELLGVTTVTGEVEKRSEIMRHLCREFGRPEIPVHDGAREVLLFGPGQPEVPHFPALGLPVPGPNGDAVRFLRDTIRAHPGEITLLTIGPLTNIALLFALDPEIPGLCKDIVSMVGVFDHSRQACEWNAMVDPVATAMTFNRSLRHRVVGLDVTLPCYLPAEEVRTRFARTRLEAVLPMAETWLARADRITFHDILAAAVVFGPDLVEFEPGRITTRLSDEAGQTDFVPGEGPHEVGKGVDATRFFDEFFRHFE